MTGKVGVTALLGAAVAGPAAAVVWPSLVKWPIVVGYEVVLFIIGLVGGIATELKKRWQSRATDRLDRALGRRFTRFGRRYREYMLSSLRFIDLKGLSTTGFYTPDLDEVFVDVSLDYRAPHQVPSGLLGDLPADAENRHSISDFLNRKRSVVLAVLGAPGSGKTTLLRHTARRVFESKNRSIPVLLYLRDHVSHIDSESLPALIRRSLGPQGESEPVDWFEQKLRQGECVVLLDGLDEVARQQDRRRVADWVEAQINRYPDNDFVLTSRPHGYRSAPIEGATVLQVRSFTDQQVQTFVHGWYFAVLRHTTKGTADEARRLADSEAEDLLGRLYDSPALVDLTVNPLLLTMIANVHRYRGALPGSRADLYSEICQVMLWRRQEAKKLPSDLDGGKKETLLRRLAFTMMDRKIRDLQEEEILKELGIAMGRVSRRVTAEEFLADVGSNGLLVERESGLFSFAHHTFQEYLAAGHIREKGLVDVLADNVDDIWWRETTLLYTARSDADRIVKACLASGTVTALSLAFDCAEQDSELDPDLYAALDNLISEAVVPGADPDRRSLAAAVLVTRHLRHTVQAGRSGRVCTLPITNKIYHLFRQEVPIPLPDGPAEFQPDDNPVVGVRWSDTVAFARWINGKIGSEQEYRPPTETEIAQPAVQRAIGEIPRSVWFASEGSGPLLWIPRACVDPRVVEADTQTEHILEDFRRSSRTLTRLLLLHSIVESRRVAHRKAGELAAALAGTLTGSRIDDLNMALDQSFMVARANDQDVSEIAYAHKVARRVNRLLGTSSSGSSLDESVNDAIQMTRGMITPDVDSELDHLLSVECRRIRSAAKGFASQDQPPDTDALAWIIGTALFRSVARSMGLMMKPVHVGEFFIESTGAASARHVIDLDGLAAATVGDGSLPSLPWAKGVAKRFESTAIPVFSRQQPLTPEKATALRLTALCLATEADIKHHAEVGDRYRMLAAGVTLMERRASGASPVTETIMLATG